MASCLLDIKAILINKCTKKIAMILIVCSYPEAKLIKRAIYFKMQSRVTPMDVYLHKISQHVRCRFMEIWASIINHFVWILNVIDSWVNWIATPYCKIKDSYGQRMLTM